MNLHHPSRPLLVLDAAIEAPEQLRKGAIDAAQVLQLDAQRHGLEQISEYLEQHRGITSLHLMAHGQPGGVQLGQTWLTSQNLDQWGDRLRQWSRSLSPQGSVVLYGCRTGAGTLGQTFLTHLHRLLGVTLAASSHVVGQGQWHFDRILRSKSNEVKILRGRSQTPLSCNPLPFHPDTLASYPGTFNIPNFLYATDNSEPARLFILNPDTGQFEDIEGSDRVQLEAETFALSRGTDGVLYYTGTQSIVTQNPRTSSPVRVYRFDPSGNLSSGFIGEFQVPDDEASEIGGTPNIVMLGQARDNKLYALTPQSQSIYVIDVEELNSDNPITAEVISLGEFRRGGGDIAFDPEDEDGNILFFTSRQGSNEYRLYRADISDRTNPTVIKIGNLVDDENDGPEDASQNASAGSLAFVANGDLFFNAGAAVFSLSREDLAAAVTRVGGEDSNQNLRSTLIRDFGAQVGGSNLSDFGSLPQLSAALTVEVDKVSEGEQISPGDEITYTITVTNEGDREISNVVVSDPIPDGVSNFRWTRNIDSETESGTGAIEDDRFTLAAGQEAIYTVVATVQSVDNLNLDEDNIVNEVTVRVPGFAIVDPQNSDRLLNSLTTSDSIEVGNQSPVVDDDLVVTTPPGEVTPVNVLSGTDDGEIDRFVIRSIPTGGTLRLGDRIIQAGDEIDPGEIGNLVFEAGENFDGSSFTYTAIDNLGAESEPGTITLNSPPQVTGGEEDVPPGTVTNLSDDLFSGEDPDGTINRYEITELPPASQGTLFIGDPERGGREVAEGETLTPDQLDRLFFRAEPGFTGTTFGFRAIDNQGAESPTAEVTLGTANAPPDTEDVLQVIEPGEPVTLNGLGGTDIESDEGDLTYRIDELPGEGTLTLDGEEVSAGAVLTPDELARLEFSFPEGFTGNTSFTYVAIDETGAEDPTPGTVFLKTEGSNIPPETEETTVEVPPNTFGGANEIPPGVATRLTGLGGNDPDGEIDEFRITRAPGNGTLFLGDPADGGRALGTDDTIPANRIDDVFFLPGDNFNGSDFAYTAIDNQSEEDPTPAEVTLEVGNRFPDTDNVTNPVPEPGEVIRLSGLGGSDDDGNISGFVINTLPNRGTLFLGRPGAGGVAVEEGQILTPDELSRLFLDVGDGSGDIRFTYSAIDNLGAIDPIPGEVRFTNQTTSPGEEDDDDEDDDPVPDLGGDPSPSPTPSPDPDPDPEPDPDFDSLCPPKPEKPEIPQLAELPDVRRPMPDALPALQVDGLEQLDSVEVLDSTAGNLVVGGSGDDEIRGSLGDDQLRGSQGNDRIVTGGGNNALAGNQGNDTLLGHLGADTLNGGQDRDLILGRGGNNVIWGDRGDDTISGGPGNDIIGGGPQNRTPDFEGSDDLIYGDGGNDTIFGNLGQTSLSGGDGDDVIFGGRGDDQVHGDAGSDTLKGEFGNDTLIGSPDTIEPARDEANEATANEAIANEDRLTDAEAFTPQELTFEFLAGLEDPREAAEDPEPSPEPTAEPTPEPSPEPTAEPTPEPSPDPVSTGDLLSGNDGDDVLFGGAGSDSLFGGDDNDWLDGGSADDLLFGDRGADTLYGNQGNNTLVGGSLNPDRIDEDGPDLLYGGIGNDLILGNRGDDTISTGNGNNLAFGGQNDDLIYGGQGSDTLKGEFGDDTLLGSSRSLSTEAAVGNILSGNKGNDVILTGQGGDTVYGGDNNDRVFGGDGEDLIFGDRGDDTIHGGEGNDTLVAANGNPLVRENDGNNLIFTGGGQDLVLGGSGNDSLVGEDGEDTIRGGRGDDMVWGGNNDDLLFGDHGNDTLCGGSGNDTLVAGNGNPNDPATGDNLLIGAAGNNVMFGNGGQDTFQGGLGNDTIFGGSGDVIVFGERGNNVIFGQRGNDTLAGGNDSSLVHGGQGNDVLFGNAGNNTLYGGQGDDTLYSGRGNSRLFGDEGDDLLFGQRGNDTLIGGGGQNGFAISNEAENNLILDFDLTQDAFVLFDGITREDLTFDSRDGQTLLQRNGQTIAILVDVGLEQVNEITFR